MPAGVDHSEVSAPESLAKSFLSQGSVITAGQILQLVDSLPLGSSNRSPMGVSFGAAAFVRIGVGLRQSCRAFPNSVQAINRFAQGVVDSLAYTSFVILENNLAPAHTDSQNSFLPNIVIPLSSFKGGEISVQCAEGEVHV